MHHVRYQARIETDDDEDDEDDHRGKADTGWNVASSDPWGTTNTHQHIPPYGTNPLNDWDVAAPSSPAKPLHSRQTSQNAHEIANYFTTALKGQQGKHVQDLQKNVQHQRQQLAAKMMQQQHFAPPQGYTQSIPQISHKRDYGASPSPHAQEASTTVTEAVSQGNNPGWGGTGWGTGWNNAAVEEGWGSGNAWAPSQNAQTGWDVSNSAEFAGPSVKKLLPDGTNSKQRKVSQSPAMTQSQSWGAWNAPVQNQEYMNRPDDSVPALIVTSPTTNPAGSIVSTKRRKNTLGSILFRVFAGRKTKPDEKASEKKRITKKTLKKQKVIEPYAVTKVDSRENEWIDQDGDEENDEFHESEHNQTGPGQMDTWSTNAGTQWQMPGPGMQSNLHVPAEDPNITRHTPRDEESNTSDYNVIDAMGAAIAPAQRAFYSRERFARYRFYWAFDPDKDARVSTLLSWIQRMQYDIATLGLSKFLVTRERGALFANADYRSPSSPHEPAFDWMTYRNIQATMDRTLQESLAFYDPSTQIVVFVFLLSKTHNSMAIWRRKLPLPENLRVEYGRQLKYAIDGLQASYPIHVDELPENGGPSTSTLNRTDSKRKWFKLGRS